MAAVDKDMLRPVDTVEEKWKLLPSFLKVRFPHAPAPTGHTALRCMPPRFEEL